MPTADATHRGVRPAATGSEAPAAGPVPGAAIRDRFAVTGPASYSLVLASEPAEVRAAQRLRYAIFAGELGATLDSPGTARHLDADPLDAYCDHILVRDDRTGEAVGTYRMLPPERAAAAGRCYSEAEFELSALAPLRESLVEVGRSCVHPDHRGGAVIGLMWAGICRYMLLTGNQWLAGCASIPLTDGGATAAGVWDRVRARHLSPPEYRVTPHTRWPDAGIVRPRRLLVPPLLRGYLRLGAWVCGEPAHDTAWNVADLFVLLAMDRIDQRYLRHFLGSDKHSLGSDKHSLGSEPPGGAVVPEEDRP